MAMSSRSFGGKYVLKIRCKGLVGATPTMEKNPKFEKALPWTQLFMGTP